MLCEKCKKRTATVFYNENINGKARSLSLCGECAAKMREQGDLDDVTSMIGSFADPFAALHDDLFGGLFGIPSPRAAQQEEKKCPSCSCTYGEIIRDGRVGCPECYAVFKEELAGLIRSVHGTTRHTGSVPSRHRAKKEREERLRNLKQEMQDAIGREDFERAAALRDEIRKVGSENDKEDA